MKENGTLVAGGYLCLSFYQKWSKLCTLLQTDPKEAEMKKNIQFFTVHLVAGSSFDNTF
jgi:hypothetical protein